MPYKGFIGEDCDHFFGGYREATQTTKELLHSESMNVVSQGGAQPLGSLAQHPEQVIQSYQTESGEKYRKILSGLSRGSWLRHGRCVHACLVLNADVNSHELRHEWKTSTCRASWLVSSPGFSLEVTLLSEFHPVEAVLTFSNPHAWVSQR